MKKKIIKCAVAILMVIIVIAPSACKKAQATFEVSSLVVTPPEVLVGEGVSVKVDVKNAGEVEGAYPVTLMVNGEALETKEVTVPGGEKETVSFALVKDVAGTYKLEIDGESRMLKVLRPATFEVSSLVVTPPEVLVGEGVSVKVDVKNAGEVEGAYPVTLMVNGEALETKEVTVPGGEKETVSFALVKDAAGTYKLAVDELSKMLEVLQPATFEVSSLVVTPAEVGLGELVIATADVKNVGNVEGTYTVALMLDKVEVAREEKWLGAGMTRRVTFEVTKDEAGSYNIEIGGQSQVLTVKKGLYRNSTYGFSLSYPPSWTLTETGERAPIIEINGPNGLPIARVFLGYLSEVTSCQEHGHSFTEYVKEFPGSQIISEGEIILADTTPAYQVVYVIPDEGDEIKGKYVCAIRRTQVFEILAFSLKEDFETNKASIDSLVSSFRLEESRPLGISREDSLTMWDVGPITLDPAIAREVRSARYIREIFSGLVTLDQDLQVVPDIAESWKVSGDGTTYTFYLRKGVRFHDGKEVKADDFKYSLERACDSETGSPTAETYLGDIVGVKEMLDGESEEISGVKVIDDYTLQITIDAAKAYFLAKLTHSPAFVVDRTNVQSGEKWWQAPNGTGPFRLRKWKEDELLILEQNDIYYQEPTKVKYAVFRLWGGIPMRMYETGETDVTDVYLADIERVLDPSNPLNQELISTPELSLHYIGFNATKPPFDDAKVRQAFCHAIDKDKIIEVVFKGTVTQADGILPRGMPGYNENLRGLSFDVDRAKELIRQSKYKDVSTLPEITFTTSGRGIVSDLNAALIEMWRENLGVEVQIRQLEPEIYFQVIKEEKDELYVSGWVADYPDPENFLDVLFDTGSEENTGEYSNHEVDALLEQARVEQDVTARIRLYQEIEQMLVNDAACLPLFFDVNYVLVKPYVEDYVVTPMGVLTLKGVSLEKTPSATEGGIKVLSTLVDTEFPKALTFNLEVQSNADISNIVLQYKVRKISYATLISEARPEFVLAPKVKVGWTWDMRKEVRLPPGADIEYRWIIKDATGEQRETTWDTVRFIDARYEWESLMGDSITLLWYSGDQAFAQELLDAALGALDKLAKDTGAHLEQPVRIYVYASSGDLRGAMVYPQEWTGGVAFTEYGIVAIGVDIDNLIWGKRCVAHEVAHLVTFQMTFNPYGDPPTWLNEGLSMYAEGDLEVYLQSILEQAISEDNLISVQSLSASFPARAEEAYLCYAESYSLADFLIQNYGRDRMLQLLSAFKEGSSYDGALLKVYNFDTDGLDDLWRQSLGLEPRSLAALLDSGFALLAA